MINNDKHIKSDWVEVVRRKAHEASKQPPAGCWEAMAARMATKAKVAPRRSRRWLWPTAASAAVALILGVGLRLMLNDASQSAPTALPRAAGQSPAASQLTAQVTPEPGERTAAKHHYRHRRRLRYKTQEMVVVEDSVNLGALYASASGGAGVPNRPMGQGDDDEAPSSSLNPWQNYSDREYDAYRQMEDNARTLGDSGCLPDALARGPRRWAVGVNVMGLSVANRNQTVVSADGSTLNYRHNMPLAVGVDVSLDFAHGAATATAGLAYTLLRTKVADAAASSSVTQSLSTVSLPIGVRWNALRRNRIRVYTGVEAAPGIVAGMPSGVTCSSRFKLLNASIIAGAQYFVSPQVSIYAEPRVAFRTATLPMPTIQGVNDVDFNLQLGAKWHF